MSVASGGDEIPEQIDLHPTQQQNIEGLRRSRSAAKANITKKIKELTEWKTVCENITEARDKSNEFVDVVAKFYDAHSKYHAAIDDEYDIIDSEKYLQTERKRIDNFTRTLGDWMTNLETRILSKEPEVKSSDSASNIGRDSHIKTRTSIASSRSKSGSSTISVRIAVRARKAALEAEKAELAKQIALEQERLRIEQRKYELKLNTELAKAEAEERVYNEAVCDETQATTMQFKLRNQTKATLDEQYYYQDTKSPRAGATMPIPTGADIEYNTSQYPRKNSKPAVQGKESEASSDIAQEFLDR